MDRLRTLRADESPDSGPTGDPADPPCRARTAGSPRAGSPASLSALSALQGLEVTRAPDAVATFWTAGDLPALPVHPDLPVDLVLRQLPAPGAALGGSRLLADLGRLYEQLPDGEVPPGPAAKAVAKRVAKAAGRPTRRAGKPPET